MKKLLLSLAIAGLIAQGAAYANSNCPGPCPIKKEHSCEKPCPEPCETKKNDCEPCVMPQTACDNKRHANIDCWYDNQYEDLKKELCDICPEAKCDLEENYRALRCCLKPLETRIDCERAKVCKLLETSDDCDKEAVKDAKKAVKTTMKDIKKCFKTFKKDTKEVLTFKERRTFNKFMRKENRKLKQMKKYCPKCDLPCVPCR